MKTIQDQQGENHFSYKGISLEYIFIGKGEKVMFAFHGFGNSADMFRVLEPSLGKNYQIYSFNLPYHGNSRMDDSMPGKTISKEALKEWLREFLHQHQIEKFSLMGYSLGGKIVLQLIELFPEQVETVFLFAPDGIRNNWSNGFVTKNKIGKQIYQRVINDPARFLRFVRMLKGMNLIHDKLSVFLHNSLDTREKRQQVWDVWMCFRDIKPDIPNIQSIINKHNINIHLFFGKHDRIIPPSIGERFVKGLKNKNSLHVVEMGHVMVKEKMNEYLLKIE